MARTVWTVRCNGWRWRCSFYCHSHVISEAWLLKLKNDTFIHGVTMTKRPLTHTNSRSAVVVLANRRWARSNERRWRSSSSFYRRRPTKRQPETNMFKTNFFHELLLFFSLHPFQFLASLFLFLLFFSLFLRPTHARSSSRKQTSPVLPLMGHQFTLSVVFRSPYLLLSSPSHFFNVAWRWSLPKTEPVQ